MIHNITDLSTTDDDYIESNEDTCDNVKSDDINVVSRPIDIINNKEIVESICNQRNEEI